MKPFFLPILSLCLLTACEPWEIERVSFPEVVTGEASEVSANTATLAGNLSGLINQDQVVQHGHLWSSRTDQVSLDNYEDRTERGREGNLTFNSTARGLQFSTTYYYRAYAVYEGKPIYGEVRTFQTAVFSVTIQDAIISNLGDKAGVRWRLRGFSGEAARAGVVFSKQDSILSVETDAVKAQGPLFLNCNNGCDFLTELEGDGLGGDYFVRSFVELKPGSVVYSAAVRLSTQPTSFFTGWKQLSDFPGGLRARPHVFPVGDRFYLTGGWRAPDSNALKELWEYQPDFNLWTKKENIPLVPIRYNALGFSIKGKIYYGGGSSDFVVGGLRDFWAYDPELNRWERKADLPVAASPVRSFVIGNKGYFWIGGGAFQYLYEFDPEGAGGKGSWNLTVETLSGSLGQAFTVDDKVYFLGASYGPIFLEFNPTAQPPDRWRNMDRPPFDGPLGNYAHFSVQGKLYLGFGASDPGAVSSSSGEWWQFDPRAGQGRQWERIPLPAGFGLRSLSTGFADQRAGFVLSGVKDIKNLNAFQSPDNYYREVWVFIPPQ